MITARSSTEPNSSVLTRTAARPAHEAIAAVLYAGPADEAYRLRCELAARDGARVPLIATDGHDFPLYRLATERVVSVNMTAAGGNASLMTLGA